MRTKESIEAHAAMKPDDDSGKTPSVELTGKQRSMANLIAPWTSDTAPRNGGRPKKDMAQHIAKRVFEDNPELIYKACVEQLMRGGAFAFQVYSDRAYGKLKETREIGQEYNEIPDTDLQDEIDKLMARLGLAGDADAAAEAGIATARAEKTNGAAKDSHLLPGNGSVKA